MVNAAAIDNRPIIGTFDGWAFPLRIKKRHLFQKGDHQAKCGMTPDANRTWHGVENLSREMVMQGDQLCPNCRRIVLEEMAYRELMERKPSVHMHLDSDTDPKTLEELGAMVKLAYAAAERGEI